MNHLHYGDNLRVLRESVADASVDLIYLDPPFNSNASYNVLFKGPGGSDSQAQIEAFDDTRNGGAGKLLPGNCDVGFSDRNNHTLVGHSLALFKLELNQ